MTRYLESVPLLPFESLRSPVTQACAALKALLDKPESVDPEFFRQKVQKQSNRLRSVLIYLMFNSWLASNILLNATFIRTVGIDIFQNNYK